MRRSLFLKSVVAGLTGLAVLASAYALREPVQDQLPHFLIERAWGQTLAGKEEVRPWPWLQSAPVARLTVPDFNESFIVMQGTTGEVLAHAPGWHNGTAYPGKPGISLIAAHRDLHFGFLPQMEPGHEIWVQDKTGREHRYTIEELRIVNEDEIEVPVSKGYGTLLLSTSIPIGNWHESGEEMRFVAVAVQKPLLTAAKGNGMPGV